MSQNEIKGVDFFELFGTDGGLCYCETMGLGMKKGVQAVIAFFAVTLLLVVFQNCGPAPLEEGDDDLATSVDPRLSNLPFPYQASANQIAYSSCPLTSAVTDGSSFTFHVGSYDNADYLANAAVSSSRAGLSLNSTFLSQGDAAINFYTPSLRESKWKEALMYGPLAASATPFISLRSNNEPAKYGIAIGSGADDQFKAYTGMLSTEAFADQFARGRTSTISFFTSGGTVDERAAGAYLSYPVGSISGEEQFRNQLLNSKLVLGFGDFSANSSGGLGPQVYSVNSSNSEMYGVGYSFQFGKEPRYVQPNLVPYSRTVSAVYEHDMSVYGAPLTANTWACPTGMKFKIVMPQHRNNTMYMSATQVAYACPKETFAQMAANANYAAIMKVVRRTLKPEQWDVNLSQRCAVPIAGQQCYGGGITPIYDDYFFTDGSANASLSPPKYAQCWTGAGSYDCAHYISICLR